MAEGLDPEEQEQFAALERLAAERDRETQQAQRELQTPERRPIDNHAEDEGSNPSRLARMDPVVTGRGVAPPRADIPLVPFISAEAVDQRLRGLEAQLQVIEAQTRHTMLLTMIFADRNNVTEKEYERAMAMAQRSEQAAKGT